MTEKQRTLDRVRRLGPKLSLGAFVVLVLVLSLFSSAPAPGNPFAGPGSVLAKGRYGHDNNHKGEPKPFYDCGKNPYKWNPYEGDFQRTFIKWCEPWTFDQNETTYDGMSCDEVACAEGSTPAEFCDFSEGGVPPEMLTCPAE